jgi:aminopeptidase N
MKIEVSLDLEKKTVDGKVTTSIRSIVDRLTSFKVDAVGMNIKSVKGWFHRATDDPKLAEDFADIKYSYDNKELTIDLGEFGIGKNFPYKYQVEYSTTDPERGLYFIQPTELFPDKPYQVWSQGEGEDNRYWFPCYDYPNDQQTTEMFVSVDSKYQTLSNGLLKSKTAGSDGTTTWHWVVDKPHVSYLVMVAAGSWDVIEDSWNGIPILSYVPPGKKDMGFKSFERTADMMRFFSEKIGFNYPWQRFLQVAVEDFIYGGMENTGAIVYYSGVVYDDKTPPDYTATNLVAHELAHQWWGDVVTCRNWNEIWLNESFATYFQCLYTEYAFGKDEFDYNIFRNGRDAINADSTTARKPIYVREGLTTNTYDKGSVVLNMLRKLIGDDKFWKAMNNYITENQFKSVSTRDLIAAVHKALDTKTPQQMPPDMKWFFDEWIYKAGQPEFNVSYTYNETAKELLLNVQQVQRLDSSSVFKSPVPVRIVTAYGTIYDQLIHTDTSSKAFTFKIDDVPNYVLFNKGNSILCKVHFTKPKQDWLNQWLNSEDAIDRITALIGMRDLASDPNVLAALESALTKDSFWGVRNEAASVLGRANFYTALEILMSAYTKEPDSRVRRTILASIASVKNNSTEQVNIGWLYRKVKDLIGNEQSYYAIADGITAISNIIDKKDIYNAVVSYLPMESHVEIIRRNVMTALDSSNDKRSLGIFLEHSEKGSTARLRNAAISGLSDFLDNPEVIDYLNKKVMEKTRSTQQVILNLLEKAKDPSSKPFLMSLIGKSNDKRFIKRVQEVLDKIP